MYNFTELRVYIIEKAMRKIPKVVFPPTEHLVKWGSMCKHAM